MTRYPSFTLGLRLLLLLRGVLPLVGLGLLIVPE
jgi:hypothetical protein